jgi:hypothetical protein
MTTLYVREFQNLATDGDGFKVPAPREPGVDQVIDYSAGEASITLGATTKFVEISTNADCHYAFGSTATVNSMRLAAGGDVFKGVIGGTTLSAVSA